MNLNNNISDKSLFQGIKYGNGLPLLADDLHELEDTTRMNLWHIYKNIGKAGLLAYADISYTDNNLVIENPFPVMIPGGYVQVVGGTDKVQATNISNNSYLCLVGWFQHITSQSIIKEYGGLINDPQENNLYYEPLGLQPSSRYQFVWMIREIPIDDVTPTSITTTILGKDAEGVDSNDWDILSEEKVGEFYLAPVSESHIVDSIVYILPVATYFDGVFTPIRPQTVGVDIIASDTAPEGEYSQGTQWYNRITHEFSTYITGEGWVQQTAKIGYIRYQGEYVIPADSDSPTITIPIQDFSENDILRVLYEGLELSPGVHYSLNTINKTITLIDFPVRKGEILVFSSTKFVGTYDITSSTLESITLHINTKASSTVYGHVMLSDTASEDDSSSGIAITPKALLESKKIVDDDDNSISYKLGISNGLLYYEEV